jgi:hypothetical protein
METHDSGVFDHRWVFSEVFSHMFAVGLVNVELKLFIVTALAVTLVRGWVARVVAQGF